MTTVVTFNSEQTGAEQTEEQKLQARQPSPEEAALAALPENVRKSIQDTRAELTRTQQELAALKKPPAAGAAPADTKPEDKKPVEEKKPEGSLSIDAAEKVVEASGFDVSAFSQEFSETGDVSPENRAKLVEGLKGVLGEQAEAVINQFIEGSKHIRSNYETEVKKAAGGAEAFAEMQTWAKTGLTADEKKTFNAAVNSGDINTARMAIDSLNARYVRAKGSNPELLGGGLPAAEGVGFRSTFEMTQAMSDPRYGKDPAYTADVQKRVYAMK